MRLAAVTLALAALAALAAPPAWAVELFAPFSGGRSSGSCVSVSPGRISSGPCQPKVPCAPRPPLVRPTYVFWGTTHYRDPYYRDPYYRDPYYNDPYQAPAAPRSSPLVFQPNTTPLQVTIRAPSAPSIQYLPSDADSIPATREPEDAEADVRAEAQIAELKGETSPERLVTYLKDPSKHVRRAAALALAERGAAAVPVLLDSLESIEPAVRAAAAEALGKLGPRIEAHVPHLTKALADRDEEVRRGAAWALSRVGPRAETAMDELILALADESGAVRSQAIESLALLGEPAVGPLIAALSDNRESIRSGAGRALGEIGRPAIEELIPLLSHRQSATRYMAAYALGEIGPAAHQASATLAQLARDSDYDVRYYAQTALDKINR